MERAKLLWRLPAILLLLLLQAAAAGPASGEHLQSGCDLEPDGELWSELVNENDNFNEDGTSANIKIQYPDGGPWNDPPGIIIRSIYAWKDRFNFAEVGWVWDVGQHNDPTLFITFRDGAAGDTLNHLGDAGARDSYHDYKVLVDPPPAKHWKTREDGDLLWQRTFAALNETMPAAASETRSLCDSAAAHFKDLLDKQEPGSPWTDWEDIHNWSPADANENPCFHTNLISNTEFTVLHGGSQGDNPCI